jgi:hypothetical protein
MLVVGLMDFHLYEDAYISHQNDRIRMDSPTVVTRYQSERTLPAREILSIFDLVPLY